jgi:hypothetical protein
MKRKLVAGLLTIGLVAVGWTVGRAAQAPQGDFELQVRDMPDGTTAVECKRGCSLQFSVQPATRRQTHHVVIHTGAVTDLRGWMLPTVQR